MSGKVGLDLVGNDYGQCKGVDSPCECCLSLHFRRTLYSAEYKALRIEVKVVITVLLSSHPDFDSP